MNRKYRILITAFAIMSLALFSAQEAQAKRFGGGRSFGSSPNYSSPFQRSAPSAAPQPGATPSRPAAAPTAPAANPAAAMPQRSGLMGMLGGLAVGGLLGSLFFGHGFSGINFLDILLFAGVAWLAFKFFAARAPQTQTAPSNAYARQNLNEPVGNGSAGFNTDLMFGKGAAAVEQTPSIPADFDQAHFLAGAEKAFRYLQSAWDQRDLAGIRGLTTDKVFAELQSQLQQDRSDNKTEVLKVQAELLEVRQVGNERQAVVLFDSIMREDDGQAGQVREVWHFIQPVNSQQSKWLLDGIQQLAE